jgi:hypothetical protein
MNSSNPAAFSKRWSTSIQCLLRMAVNASSVGTITILSYHYCQSKILFFSLFLNSMRSRIEILSCAIQLHAYDGMQIQVIMIIGQSMLMEMNFFMAISFIMMGGNPDNV